MFVRRQAQRLGLKGWVRNLRDGRVEAVAVGTHSALTELEGLMKEGPANAVVEAMVVGDGRNHDGPNLNSDFELRPDHG